MCKKNDNWDYGYMPYFIGEVLSSKILNGLQNKLNIYWNRKFRLGKNCQFNGNGFSFKIKTPNGIKEYKVTVKESN